MTEWHHSNLIAFCPFLPSNWILSSDSELTFQQYLTLGLVRKCTLTYMLLLQQRTVHRSCDLCNPLRTIQFPRQMMCHLTYSSMWTQNQNTLWNVFCYYFLMSGDTWTVNQQIKKSHLRTNNKNTTNSYKISITKLDNQVSSG